jgi:hypothetical protein
MHAQSHVRLNTKCTLLLSDFNQTWNVAIFGKTATVVVIICIHSVYCVLYFVCSFVCCVSFDRGVILCGVCYLFAVLLHNHCHRVKTHMQLK